MLYNTAGVPFDAASGGLGGDEWKEYAQQSDKVWYYRGSNTDDVISVDFVTEPGLLADHHLITRLTNNDGNYTFDAQIRLDFEARGPDGQLIWNPTDVLFNLEALSIENPADREAALADNPSIEAELSDIEAKLSDLLPPEGDYLVILIDALGGADQVTVGPTVQRTVWIDAGSGDDRVEILSGRHNPARQERTATSQ